MAMSKRRAKRTPRRATPVVENDNLAIALDDLVPESKKGTDRYLDVIQWNIEWFGAAKSRTKDRQRYDIITDILEALNGDLFIFQEITGPSKDGRYHGVLDGIAEELTRRGAGDYVVFYTDAGGEQRVAMMWDRDWLRAKTDVKDLFERGTYKMRDGKDAFAGRTPLYGHFAARVPGAGGTAEGFDFQALGVHLKAMGDGMPQRLESAKVLSEWMVEKAPTVDSDVLIMGDWNAPPDDKSWAPIHQLEDEGLVKFRDINDPTDFSYLWLANKSTRFTSKIDLTAMSLSSMKQVKGKPTEVVRWKPIEDTLAKAGNLTDKKVIEVLRFVKENISDHLPTVARFYFKQK